MRSLILALFAISLLVQAPLASAEKTDKIVVKVKPGASVEELCSSHPLVKLERASTLPRVFLFSVENINVDKETIKFVADSRVVWAHVDEVVNYEAKTNPVDPSWRSGLQWHHYHINSSYAWSAGLSGQNQLVQVVDTPVNPVDLDLKNQLDFEKSFEGNITFSGTLTHGTVCTSLIVGEANDFCGVGVAFSARVSFFPFIANSLRAFSDLDFAEAFAIGFPVSSNSYGKTQCFWWGCNVEFNALAPVIQDALQVAQSMNNTVFVFAAGNEGDIGGSPNFMAFGSTPRIMMVGATRYNGTRAIYSNVGAANWIVAPAGEEGDQTTWTSSVSVDGQQQCGEVGGGTSFATPMVSGAAAILRSAYPSLSWRDVKYILAYSADKTDPDHPSWIQNAAGRWFSNHFGFGQLNVGKAVELGTTWKHLGPLQIRTYHSNLISPYQLTEKREITASVSVPRGIFSRVESVQLTLDMALVSRGNFQVDLFSPSGTLCIIFPFRNDINRNYNNYVTSANCFLDEDPAGSWTLRVTRRNNTEPFEWGPVDELRSFAVTVWGESMPSQVQLVASSEATRLSNFTITEGDTFQQLTLFHNFPATIGLFWKDSFGLYGELFTTEGEATTGTQRLNPSNSDHPTISVFYGGDHVLTYLTTINDSLVLQAQVRNIDFVPLTPLLTLPITDISPRHLSAAAIEDKFVVSYRPRSSDPVSKLTFLQVDFGSRDTTPCFPSSNVTVDSTGDGSMPSDDPKASEGECTQMYKMDGKISVLQQIEIQTFSPIDLQSIGMNLILGTWLDDNAKVVGALIRSATSSIFSVKFPVPSTRIIRAAATPEEDIFIAFGYSEGVLLKQFDKSLQLKASFEIYPSQSVMTALDLTYSHMDGLSLVMATTKEISVTTFLRSPIEPGNFVQTNQATIALILSFPVLDIAQAVMPNGDLAVTFSTVQEIHVQVFTGSIFGTLPLTPESTIQPPTSAPTHISAPSTVVPKSIEEEPSEESQNRIPTWAIALIVLGGSALLLLGVMVIYLERKKRRHRAKTLVQQDPDLIAYTKMSV